VETNIEQLQKNLSRSRHMLASVRHGIAAYSEVDLDDHVSGWVEILKTVEDDLASLADDLAEITATEDIDIMPE